MNYTHSVLAGLAGGLLTAGLVVAVAVATGAVNVSASGSPRIPTAASDGADHAGEIASLQDELHDLRAELDDLRTRQPRGGASSNTGLSSDPASADALPAETFDNPAFAAQLESWLQLRTGSMAEDAVALLRRDAAERYVASGGRNAGPTPEEILAAAAEALNSEDPEVRRAAMRALRNADLEEAIDLVLPMLEDSDTDVRMQAVKFIDDVNTDPRVYEDLVSMLETDRESDVTQEIVQALSGYDTPQAWSVIESYYRTGADDETAYEAGKELVENDRREVAAQSLSRWRGLLNDEDPDSRRLGISALYRFGSAEDAPLVEPLLQDPDDRVRRTAEEVLARWNR